MVTRDQTPIAEVDDRSLRRAGEAPRLAGNTVTLLRDGPVVFASWLQDIAAAQHFILFENYIFHSDHTGESLVDALIARAAAGVQVYVLYDWFGCLSTNQAMWRRLTRAGVKVRAFSPIHLSDPVRVLKRDHRKLMCIDGVIGHVGGLCVGNAWAGDPAHGVPPWRDTAVRIYGPAAAALCATFDETWSEGGTALPPRLYDPLPHTQDTQSAMAGAGAAAGVKLREDTPCGEAPVRVVSGSPGRSRIYRLTQVLLARAVTRIWITDAYFLTPPTMYEALLAAARDGIDVRVLVPGRSDLPWISWLGRSGYAGLLQAGVRVFEWEGPMLHAKTMVVDSTWCRIGSSNLNLASLLTNWELDVLVEDSGFAEAMEQMFLNDQKNSQELMLRAHRARTRVLPADASPIGEVVPTAAAPSVSPSAKRARRRAVRRGTRTVIALAGAAVLGVALRRQFEPSAWTVSLVSGLALLSIGGLGMHWSTVFGATVAVLCFCFGLGALLHALANYSHGRRTRPPRRSRKRRNSSERLSDRAPASPDKAPPSPIDAQ